MPMSAACGVPLEGFGQGDRGRQGDLGATVSTFCTRTLIQITTVLLQNFDASKSISTE